MTRLGKVFTTILMLLSVTFFVIAVLANLTYVNYTPILNNPDTGLKAVAQRLQTRVSDLNDQIQKQKAAIELEIASRQAALAALQVQFEHLTASVRESEKTLAAKEAEIYALAKTAATSKQDLSAAGEQVKSAREQMDQARAQRDDLFGKYQNAYASFLRLQGEHRTLKAQYEQMTATAPASPSAELSPSDVR